MMNNAGTWEDFKAGVRNWNGVSIDSLPEDYQEEIRRAWEDGTAEIIEIGNGIEQWLFDEQEGEW
jgi:hypothetical protein